MLAFFTCNPIVQIPILLLPLQKETKAMFKKYQMGEGITAFSTQRGTAGESPYSEFNITHYCGDSREHVAKCRRRLCATLGISDNRLILPRQTHGCEVLSIDNRFMERSTEEQEHMLHGIDAIITTLPRTCIGVSTADCTPLLLCDRKQGVIAAVHAGWRGTVQRIAEKCIFAMVNIHGCNPQDIQAVIAPCIGPAAFEVGDEVYTAFEEAGFPMNAIATRYDKWHIDLWETNRLQLVACGMCDENIEVTRVCTYTNHNEWFSARRLGINSGRIFNGIMIE